MNATDQGKCPSPLSIEEPLLGTALGFLVGASVAVAYPIVWMRLHLSDGTVYELVSLCAISLAEWVPIFVVFGLSGGIVLALLGRFLPRVHRAARELLLPLWVLGAFILVACIYNPEQFRYIYAVKCALVAVVAAIPSYYVLARICRGYLRGRKALLAVVIATAVLIWVPLGILKLLDVLPVPIGEHLS
jgi:phosphoglycerol transferase MdoB-like AlkP superfamily enzyme